jgi:charged multivesicular body protein 6
MGNLFGIRRRGPEVTAQDRAVLRLKQQRDKIKIYQKKTEADLAKNADLALKLFKSGMKDRALIVLRRKKMMEDILARTDGQLATLESLVADIEFTQIEVSVVEGLRVGTEALKQLNSLMNIEDIQQMMDDNAEAAEKQREISAVLSQSSERYDDHDLLKELEKYQADATAEELEKLPKVPETKPVPAEQPIPGETDELAEEEAESSKTQQDDKTEQAEAELEEGDQEEGEIREHKNKKKEGRRERVLVMEQ